jgi:hypothetical protein
MLFSKTFLFACAAVAGLFGGEAEGRQLRKSKDYGWRRHVNRKCVNEFDVALTVGGQITRNMIRVVTRAIETRKMKNLTIMINGRDLVQPEEGKRYRRRNIRFFKKISRKAGIVAFPWRFLGELDRYRKHEVAKQYAKSCRAIKKYIKVSPRAIYVDRTGLNRKMVYYLKDEGFITIGDTVGYKRLPEVDGKSSFVLSMPPLKNALDATYKWLRDSEYNLVDISTCLDKKIYTKKY